jgi:hypothetical protein
LAWLASAQPGKRSTLSIEQIYAVGQCMHLLASQQRLTVRSSK